MQLSKRLAFFTRLLDDASAAERYRLATEQIILAEELGCTSAWVAQHHFNGHEGGLPSPFVFLAQVAARTSIIRLGTGVVTLLLEDPVRVAEDAAVLDLLCNNRLELGISAGNTFIYIRGYPSKEERDKRLKAAHDDPEFDEVVTRQEKNPDTRLIVKARNIDMVPSGTYTAISIAK